MALKIRPSPGICATAALLAWAGLVVPTVARAEQSSVPAATPYRPTVSNPAELSAPGWLEMEAGLSYARDGDGRRRALPYTAKLAFGPDWGLMISGEAHITQGPPGERRAGGGDTALTLKHRIASGRDDLNFGFEAGAKLPTAGRGLGSRKTDSTATAIASLDVAPGWRIDANYGATRLGAPAAGQGRYSIQWAASLSHGIGAWTIAAELSRTRQAGAPAPSQRLLAAACSVTPQLVLDVGVASDTAGQQIIFVGMSWLAVRLF